MLKVIAKPPKNQNLEKTLKELARITKLLKIEYTLAVGLPSNALPYPDGTSVVMVGFWNEFGTKYVPERSFLRNALRDNRAKWMKLAREVYTAAVKRGTDPRKAIQVVGEAMQLDVQVSIDSGAWEPNTGAYAEWKAARGKNKPLINTGHMRGSIRYVIEDL